MATVPAGNADLYLIGLRRFYIGILKLKTTRPIDCNVHMTPTAYNHGRSFFVRMPVSCMGRISLYMSASLLFHSVSISTH